MNAFTAGEGRLTEIYGSCGELRGDGQAIRVTDFRSGALTVYQPEAIPDLSGYGHMGGDLGIMRDFIAAVRAHDPRQIASDIESSLAAHLMAFAAERSRQTHTVQEITI